MVHEALAPLQPRGWVILLRSAANYEAAKALAMQPPVCQPEFSRATHSPKTALLRQAQETATDAARAYLACDLSSLSAVSDGSRLGEKCFLPEDNSQVRLGTVRVSGNDKLALSRWSVPLRLKRAYRRLTTRIVLDGGRMRPWASNLSWLFSGIRAVCGDYWRSRMTQRTRIWQLT